MAPLGESTMIWSALVTVLIYACCCIPMTLSTNVQCIDDINKCIYNCSRSESQMFNCGKNMDTTYMPPLVGGQSYCCPAYFLTPNRKCQKCRDVEFMPNVNKCCQCNSCRDCDTPLGNSIKEPCTRERNTVCLNGTDSPSPGSICPTEEPPTSGTTTASPMITTTNVSNSPMDPQKSTSDWTPFKPAFFIFLTLFLLIALPALCCCCKLIRLAGRRQDQPDNRATDTWNEAMYPLANKMRKTVLACRDRIRGLAAHRGRDPPGNGGRDPPGNGGRDPPGNGGRDPPGNGGRDPPGNGGRDPPGNGGRDPPGNGGRDPPGNGGRDPPGNGGRDPSGNGGRDPPGTGGRDPPGNGGRDPPRNQGEEADGNNKHGESEGEDEPDVTTPFVSQGKKQETRM